MRRRILVPLVAVLAAGGLAVGTSASLAGASVSAKAAPVCAGKTKKQAIKDIKLAFDYFLNGSKGYTDDQKAAFIENMDTDAALKALLVAGSVANADAAKTTNVKVSKVKCTGKKTAEVTADLVISGAVTPGIFPNPGGAVLVGKVWKVTQQNYCDLNALGDPSILESGPCAG
jgi:hypothetical protein